jgi:predicted RNA binding protein YcfA (HicA-like mRNA interferase family)
MSQIEKLLEKFLSNPESVKYKELDRILIHLGFMFISTKGSHKKYKHQNFPYDLIIPVHNNECKNFYKKETYKKIKDLIKKS